jgi:2-dehydropantoate 2-reductase
MLNILVMGAGAIGCFVGGTLAAAGHQVTLVGRPVLMAKIAAAGLSLGWPNQSPQTVWPQTATGLEGLTSTFDFILITVKATATAAVAHQLTELSLLPGQTHLVSLQNGLGNEETLAAAFGRDMIIAGTITIPIQAPEPGVIRVSKAKGGLGLAPMAPHQPLERLAAALNDAGLNTATYGHYQDMKWSKLLLNIINNASSAILDETPAQIIDQPALFDLEIRALREAVAVMQADGRRAVNLPGYPVEWLARLVAADWLPMAAKRVILRPFMRSGRGTKMPSLHIDLTSGRTHSEVDALNGAIVQAGRRLGIATPVNAALTNTLNGLLTGQLDRNDFQHRPEKLLAQLEI